MTNSICSATVKLTRKMWPKAFANVSLFESGCLRRRSLRTNQKCDRAAGSRSRAIGPREGPRETGVFEGRVFVGFGERRAELDFDLTVRLPGSQFSNSTFKPFIRSANSVIANISLVGFFTHTTRMEKSAGLFLGNSFASPPFR